MTLGLREGLPSLYNVSCQHDSRATRQPRLVSEFLAYGEARDDHALECVQDGNSHKSIRRYLMSDSTIDCFVSCRGFSELCRTYCCNNSLVSYNHYYDRLFCICVLVPCLRCLSLRESWSTSSRVSKGGQALHTKRDSYRGMKSKCPPFTAAWPQRRSKHRHVSARLDKGHLAPDMTGAFFKTNYRPSNCNTGLGAG